jgi:ribosomal protein S18 acetylase RimI-like enzyme
MKIDKVLIEDFAEISEMFADLQNEHAKNEPDIFKKNNPESDTRERFTSDLENENLIYLKAIIDDTIVGYISTRIVRQQKHFFYNDFNLGRIEQIYTLPSFRGQGIAKKLILEIELLLKKNGIYEIELFVWSFNKSAVNLYSSLDFTSRMARYSKKITN